MREHWHKAAMLGLGILLAMIAQPYIAKIANPVLNTIKLSL